MTNRTDAGGAARTRLRGLLAVARRASRSASSTLSHLAAFGLVAVSIAVSLAVINRTPAVHRTAAVPQHLQPDAPRVRPPAAATPVATESKDKPPPMAPVPTAVTPPPETGWPAAEVEAAASICGALLQSSGMQYAMLQPLKHGGELVFPENAQHLTLGGSVNV